LMGMVLALASVMVTSASHLFTVTIGPTAIVSRSGVVTLSGTATCGLYSNVTMYGQLQQPVGRTTLLQGYFSASFPCSGITPWSVTVAANNGRFAGGPATASVYYATACAVQGYFPYPSDCSNTQVPPTTIQLKGGGH
jgi:hypothetical protein